MNDATMIDLHVRKGWVFWQAIRLDEPVGEFDEPHRYRSLSRQGAIDKARRIKPPRWDKVSVCVSCPEEMPEDECGESKRPCGHHCNCSWTQDICHWCGEEFGEQADTRRTEEEG